MNRTESVGGRAPGRKPLVVATGNPHKVEELDGILGGPLADLGFGLLGLAEATGGRAIPEPDETGVTFLENASIKARAYAEAVGLPCLADDSGLEIDALGGAPGVISSHYFNDGRTDGAAAGLDRAARDDLNNRRVLDELSRVPEASRTARFVCVLVVWAPGESRARAVVRGTFEGSIGEPPRVPAGANGFGYDPLFVVGDASAGGRTSAELGEAEKNRLSHRADACRRLIAELAQGALDGL